MPFIGAATDKPGQNTGSSKSHDLLQLADMVCGAVARSFHTGRDEPQRFRAIIKHREILEEADDVAAWLWNDQSGVGFRIQYSFEGRMPYYYPDFLVRLTDGKLYIIESKGSIRERDRAKQARAERYTEILRDATDDDWNYVFLINDASIGRRDVAWWRQQGRTLFRDMVKYIENAATGSGGL